MAKSAFYLLLITVAIGVSGAYVTMRFVSDSPEYFPDHFSEAQITQAEQYLRGIATICLDHPLTNAFVLKTRLLGFEATPSPAPPPETAGEEVDRRALSRIDDSIADQYKFDAVVRTYTYFAIPIGRIEIVRSEEVSCKSYSRDAR